MEKLVRCVAFVAAAVLAGGMGAQSLSRNPNGPKERSGQVTLAPLPASVQTITQSASAAVTASNSISCNAGPPNFRHTDNSYYRGFTLASFAALTLPQFMVQQVTIGVEQASATPGPTQPITLRIWNATANPIGGAASPPGNNQVATDTFDVGNQALTQLPLTLTTPPVLLVASDVLAVEIFAPDGRVLGNTFLIGSNGAGQIAPTYLKAAFCGITNISDLALFAPDMHVVMQVMGNNQTPVELQTFGVE